MVMLVLLIYFIFFSASYSSFWSAMFLVMVYGCTSASGLCEPRHNVEVSSLLCRSNRLHLVASHPPHERDEGRLFLTAGAVIAWFWVCSTFFFLLFIAHAVARTTIWRNIFFLAQRKMVFSWRENCAKRQNDEFSAITACSVMFGAHFRRHCCVYLCASVYVCRHP